VFAILSELALANANQKRPRIAILSERDKVEMEDDIRAKVGTALGHTRVVCRSGSPMDLTDLEIVNPHAALEIIAGIESFLVGEGISDIAEIIGSALPNRTSAGTA
jgi:hypothetical protein